MGFEGIISKQLDAPYRSGRGGSWLKTKSRAGQEVVIGGWTSEAKKLSSLLVGRPSRQEAGLCRPGRHRLWRSGDAQAAAQAQGGRKQDQPVRRRRQPAQGTQHSLDTARAGGRDRVRRLDRRRQCAAGCLQGAAQRQAGRRGRGRETRSGGEGEDGQACPEGSGVQDSSKAASGKASGPAVVMGVSISHPDKPLWPDEKPPVTKLELAQYYEAVGDWMIEHSRAGPARSCARPTASAARRSSSATPCPAAPISWSEVKVSGDKKPYLQIDRVEGLAAVAQIGATELHPWNCQPGEPELPGRLVFDLDPAPDVGFAEVIKGAREVRKRLEALGLKTFCKTTGGKGLHVVTPLTSDPEEPGLGRRQDVRQGDLPAAGRRRARSLRAQHGEEGARRPHLPRLSAQRPHVDRRGAAVAARARRAPRSRCRSTGRR